MLPFMATKLRERREGLSATTFHRLAGQGGFTLIELLMVLVIIGILLAIAVPSYLGFRGRAEKPAAQANVRSAIPTVEVYYADHGNYQFNLTPTNAVAATPLAALQAIDQSISATTLTTITPGAATYTIASVTGACTATKAGPAAAIVVTGASCP
jgi:type IV pilus assembly protein PilA